MTTLAQARRQFMTSPEPADESPELEPGLVDELRRSGIDLGGAEQTLRWREIVLTGRLSETRAEITAEIKAHGGTVTSSVTHSTNLVVLGQTNGDEPSKKLKKARAYGIRIVGENTLRRLMKGEDA